jgi:catechol 2,3-dioxygenase-like lactoylglutathione lyase family enzyme
MRLNQVTLAAPDMSASRAFYETLGFIVLVDSAPHYMRFLGPDGETTLSLHETDDPPTGDGVRLYLECDDLDASVAALTLRGIVFDGAIEDQSWLWREAWLRDPAGNRLCLFHAGKNRIDPPWRVKP